MYLGRSGIVLESDGLNDGTVHNSRGSPRIARSSEGWISAHMNLVLPTHFPQLPLPPHRVHLHLLNSITIHISLFKIWGCYRPLGVHEPLFSWLGTVQYKIFFSIKIRLMPTRSSATVWRGKFHILCSRVCDDGVRGIQLTTVATLY